MKKVLSLAAFGLLLASMAAPQKLAVLAINDRAAILNQAGKLGELTGAPIIGVSAVGLLAANPLAADYGAPRDGAVTTIAVYGDPETLKSAAEFDAFAKTLHYAVVYPASVEADAFAAKKGIEATNGVYTVDGDSVVYAPDGKWVAIGDDVATARAELATAGKVALKQGEVVRVDLAETAVAAAAKVMDIVAAEMPEAGRMLAFNKDVLAQVKGFSFALRVTEKGVDFLYDFGCQPGSELGKMGLKRLTADDPLSFAGKEALYAGAAAADCGTRNGVEQWEKIVALLKKHGLKLDFVSWKTEGTVTKIVLDAAEVARLMASGEGERWVAALESDETLQKDFVALAAEAKPLVAAGPAMSCSFSIKGQELATTPSARFAKALPELKGKPLYTVGVISFYFTIRKVVDAALAVLPESAGVPAEQLEMIRNVLLTLPSEGDGCTAIAAWREGDAHAGIVRLTPDEVKGLSSIVKLVFSSVEGTLTTAGGADGGAFGEELPDDED